MVTTKAQRILARLLRREGLKVVENILLPGGEADIFLPDYKVIVELDGYFHLSTETQKRDALKENNWIKSGYQVFRFRNGEIYSQKALCLKTILEYIRVVEGVANEKLGAPLKDHQILKKIHRRLLTQEQKEKVLEKKVNPKIDPEAYFLSLDDEGDSKNNE